MNLKKLIISTGTTCNIRCRYCYVHSEENSRNKSIRTDIGRVGHSLWNLKYGGITNIDYVQFLGGEPSLEHEFLELCLALIQDIWGDQGGKSRVQAGIVSNGVWTNPDAIFGVISSHKLDVTISLDGTKEINDLMRVDKNGCSVHDAVLSTIDLLRNHSCPFAIESVLGAHNIQTKESLYSLMDYASRLGAFRLYFDPMFPPGPFECSTYSPAVFPVFMEAISYATVNWIEYFINSQKQLIECSLTELTKALIKGNYLTLDKFCTSGSSLMSIDAFGKIRDCPMFDSRRCVRLGNDYPTHHSDIQGCSECEFRFWCKTCPATNQRYGDAFVVTREECLSKKLMIYAAMHALRKHCLLTETEAVVKVFRSSDVDQDGELGALMRCLER